MMIQNIILDIGNVLAAFCWEDYFKTFGFGGATYEKLAQATVLSPQWDEFDKGALTEEQVLELFVANDPSVENEIRKIHENMKDIIEVYPYSIPWMEELKSKGFQVYILSNFSGKQYRECGEKLEFIKHADDAILSFQEKQVKPQPEIYETLLTRYQLNPSECIFLDDKPQNIIAARKAGMHGIVFRSFDQAKEWLAGW